MGANIRIFSMRSARFWGNFKVWGQNIHPWFQGSSGGGRWIMTESTAKNSILFPKSNKDDGNKSIFCGFWHNPC